MRVKVLTNYGGTLTGDQRIVPGEYDWDDAALFGIGQYLLDHGHAVLVQGGTRVTADPQAPAGVVLDYIGTNTRAIAVTVDGTDYAVPKADGNKPRRVTVAPQHVDNLLERLTFARAEGTGK